MSYLPFLCDNLPIFPEDDIFETLGFTYKDDPQSIEYKLRTLEEENLVSPMRKVSVG